MNHFAYRAVDAAGVLHTGALDSASRAQALEFLSRRGLVPLWLGEGEQAQGDTRSPLMALGHFRYRRHTQASQRELLDLTQSLGALLKAGLNIDRALQITSSLAPRPASRLLSENLLEAVRAGRTLSAALTASGQRLPAYFVSMVEAGEAGGALPESLLRLAALMGRQSEIRERIQSALVYPALLGIVVLATLVILLVFVLPRFELLFSESDARLPWSTAVVLSLGRLTADYWWLLLLGVLVVTVAFVTWLKSTRGRFQYDRWLLRTRLTLGLPAALDTGPLAENCREPMPQRHAVVHGVEDFSRNSRQSLSAGGAHPRDTRGSGRRVLFSRFRARQLFPRGCSPTRAGRRRNRSAA